jgi:hypothetical protein
MRTITATLVALIALGAVGANLGLASSNTSPVGSYSRIVTKADMARTKSFRHEGPGQEGPPTGRYRLVVNARSFHIVDPTGFVIAQTYATRAGTFTIKAYVDPSKGSFCGPDVPQNASYKWRATSKTLALKPTDDRCADRNSILGGVWTKAK